MEGKFDKFYKENEIYWLMRLRVVEINEGDQNISYFYYKESQRRRNNIIKGLYDFTRVWRDSKEFLFEIVTGYY